MYFFFIITFIYFVTMNTQPSLPGTVDATCNDTFVSFLSSSTLRLESVTPDVGTLAATIGVDDFNVDHLGVCIGCGYERPNVLIPQLLERIDNFVDMFSRLQAFDDGVPIPGYIASGSTVRVFWPETEEICRAMIVTINATNCTAHVKWLETNPELETVDLCIAWIIPLE